MAGAGVLTTLLTTADATRVLTVTAAGIDLTGDVQWASFTVTDSGTNAKGTANFRIERTPSAIAEITDQALVRVYDHSASGGEVFRGFARSRKPSEDPARAYLEIIADDLTSLLDDSVIDVEYRSPESMQARLGYLWGKYAGQFLSGDFQYVQSVGSTLPAQRFALVSLRNAIEMTLAQASSTAEYYVDMLGKLHVFTTETNNPPFNIHADAPGGGEIAPESLDIEYDSNSYANRVFVSGATPASSGYVQDDAAIAAANGLVRTAVVQAPDCTTATMAQSLALMYLGRVKTAKPRGQFTTTSPNDGWRAGQNVLVTSAAHGLTNQSYRIARVTTRVLLPGANMKRCYSVEFGGARAGAGIDGVAPLIAGSTAGIYMLDQLGNAIISNAAAANSGGLGPAVRRYITSGLYNSDWYAPPPGPDAPISNTTNPLPFWTRSNDAGGPDVVMTSVLANTGSGRRIELSIQTGTGQNIASLGQDSPINASDSNAFFHNPKVFVTNTGGTAPATISARISCFYLTAANVQTGSINTVTATLAAIGVGGTTTLSTIANNGRVPSDAYILRVLIDLKRDAAAADTGAIQFSEVWIESDQGKLPQGALSRRTTTQSIVTSTWSPVAFNASEDYDPFGFHDTGVNPSRFTVPTGWGGTYSLVGRSGFAASTATREIIGWGLNGAAPADSSMENTYIPAAAFAMNMEAVTVKELAVGDYVELMVWHNQGANINTGTVSYGAITYIGELV